MQIKLKRAYEDASKDDGIRILVDRLWPRGVSKEKAAIDHWVKELAPSTELRKWFGHDPEKWSRFRGRYLTEIKHHPDEIKQIKGLAKDGSVTLVYGAHDEKHNQAVVLKSFLER